LNPDVVEAIEALRGRGTLSPEQAATLSRPARGELVSIHWELRTLLYAGVLLATSGVGLFLKENHERLEKLFHPAIDEAAANGVPNIITFSGNRKGMADAEGADNCEAFLNRVKAHAEDKGVTICMEFF